MNEVHDNQSPNMYVDWRDIVSGSYDLMTIDWKCETDGDGLNTFWAVHNWDNGYAGFQNKSGNHVVILSIWDHDGMYPEIEYVSSLTRMSDLNFENEGEGKHIINDFNWQIDTWYSMCVGTKTVCGKTYYAQWVSERGTDKWILMGIISFPISDQNFNTDSFFQEDFASNNLKRKSSIGNAHIRNSNNHVWNTLSSFKISNSIYRWNEEQQKLLPTYNVNFDCDYGINGSSIWVESGGKSLNPPIPKPELTIPYLGSVTNSSSPPNATLWGQTDIPKYIKSFNGLYVNPTTDNKVVQNNNKYFWNFINSWDGYFYIVDSGMNKAITLDSPISISTELRMSTFNNLDTQKWTKRSYGDSELVYFSPKNYPNIYICVKNESTAVNAPLGISSYLSPASVKWKCFNESFLSTLKNSYIPLFVYPTAANMVYLNDVEYIWNFIKCDNNKYYIVTPDNKKAITASGLNNGDDLILTDFTLNNNYQKWNISLLSNNRYTISAHLNNSKYVDPENVRRLEYLELYSYSNVPERIKWEIDL